MNQFATTIAILLQTITNFSPAIIHQVLSPKVISDPIVGVAITQKVTPVKIKPIAQKPIEALPAAQPVQVESSASQAPNTQSSTANLAGAAVAGCGDNAEANYIYTHESGCNPTSTNAGGCYGIGQDCNAVVKNQCGADYACQNAFFTNYANTHCDYHLGYAICYNGWAGAYQFWLTYHYW